MSPTFADSYAFVVTLADVPEAEIVHYTFGEKIVDVRQARTDSKVDVTSMRRRCTVSNLMKLKFNLYATTTIS